MRLAKALSAIGRTCITAGVLILLFVVYQLYGTGIRERQAQDRLRSQFESQLAQSSGEDNATIGSTTSTSSTPNSDTVTTETLPATTVAAEPAPPEGNPIGKIEIPKMGLSAIVVEGVADADLHEGPGHYPGTPLPGQEGNAAVAGHRTTYGAPFGNIDDLVPGDEIKITTFQGAFTYKVVSCDTLPTEPSVPCEPGSGHVVVSPNATQVLDEVANKNTLTLTACHPKYTASQRIIVFGELQGTAKPAASRSPDAPKPALSGLSGKGAPKLPVIILALVCAAIWIAAWRLGKLWRKWPSYLIGLPFFLVALFYFFENFSRLLPSNY